MKLSISILLKSCSALIEHKLENTQQAAETRMCMVISTQIIA